MVQEGGPALAVPPGVMVHAAVALVLAGLAIPLQDVTSVLRAAVGFAAPAIIPGLASALMLTVRGPLSALFLSGAT